MDTAQLLVEVERLYDVLDKLQELHYSVIPLSNPLGRHVCAECEDEWPCATVAVIEASRS